MNCKVCSNTTTNTPGIPFFRFPKEVKKCQRWAELCHLKCTYMKKGPVQLYKSFRICSDHFDADEMMHDGRKVQLFPSAEPKFLLKKFRKFEKKPENKAVLKKFNATKMTLPNHFCRLCAEVKQDVISIYGWRGKTTYDLEKKLKYFPFPINRCDILPLGVCQDCRVKVDQFSDFVESCIKAQTKLNDLVNDRISNRTVQLVNPIREILANSLLVQEQETQKTSAGETQDTSLSETQTISGGEEQTQSVYKIQNTSTNKAQSQHVNENQNAGTDEAQVQVANEAQNTDLDKTLSFNETESPYVNEAQNTILNETEKINPPRIDLYKSLLNVTIEEKNQDCSEPVSDLMKFSDDDLLTLYGANDSEITVLDANLSRTYSNVPTNERFAPPQMTNETVNIKATFDNIDQSTCNICFKDFETPEMLNSHLIAYCIKSNDDSFEKCTALDFFPDLNEEISKKAKELDRGIDSSNTEPNESSEVEPERTKSPVEIKKSSLKGKKKVRRKKKPQCEFCEKLFPTLEECQEHEKTHQGIQRYECLQCKKTFRSKRGLHRHFPVHSGETFPCPQCETIFRRRDSLLNHKRVHRRFVCKICNFVFKHKATFLKHEKDHELSLNLPSELYDADQAEKEFSASNLPDLISEGDLPVSEALDEFLASADQIQPTCIAGASEFTPMDDIEQIVANRLVAMEI